MTSRIVITIVSFPGDVLVASGLPAEIKARTGPALNALPCGKSAQLANILTGALPTSSSPIPLESNSKLSVAVCGSRVVAQHF